MTFSCSGCGKTKNFFSEFKMSVITPEHEKFTFCRDCRSGTAAKPDVFWDGKPEEGLADDPNTGKPRTFGSAGEKAAYLKSRGLHEAGDRVHGAPASSSSLGAMRRDSRHEVRMALKQVREMGRDVRRQAYLKIVKEGRDAQAKAR